MEVASHEVLSRMVWASVRLLERANLPVERLFDGLPYDLETFAPRKFVPWDDYLTMLDNVLVICGDLETLDDVVEEGYHAVVPELRLVARAVVEPKAFVRFVLEVLDPIAFPALHFACRDLGPHDMCLTVNVRPGARPSENFMRFSFGALRGITRHLDLPPTKILRAEIAPERGVYWLRVPESRTVLHRAKRLSASLLARVTGNVMFGTGDPPDPVEARLDEVIVDWRLSRRQAQVLRLLVQGQANKEIAGHLECAENTVELHVTQLLRKADVSSRGQLLARFWRDA